VTTQGIDALCVNTIRTLWNELIDCIARKSDALMAVR